VPAPESAHAIRAAVDEALTHLPQIAAD
jgi:predicted alternative tryptophan synthase beta-subunit